MIIIAYLEGHPNEVSLDYHAALDQPVVSRYAATSPELLGWFKEYNRKRSYRDQVKPFNFLVSLQAGPESDGSKAKEVRPIARFHKNNGRRLAKRSIDLLGTRSLSII